MILHMQRTLKALKQSLGNFSNKVIVFCVQWRRRCCHLVSLRGEDVLSSQQLPPCSGLRHDEPGPGLRHRSPPFIRPKERLHPGYVSLSVESEPVY